MENLTKRGKWGIYLSGSLILISAIIVIGSLGVVDEVGGCGEGVKTENEVSGNGEKVAGDERAQAKNVSIEEEEAEKKAEQEREEILSLYQPIDSNDYCADFPDFKKVGDLTQGKREIVYNQYANQGNQAVAKKAPSKKKKKQTIYEEITELALAPSNKNPLPMMGTWSAGSYFKPDSGYEPHWQMDLIEGNVDGKQHYWIPMWTVPAPDDGLSTLCFNSGSPCMNAQKTYFTEKVNNKSALQRAAEHNLPIALVGGNYHAYLLKEPYTSLPDADNPGAIAFDPNSPNIFNGRFLWGCRGSSDPICAYPIMTAPFASRGEGTKKQLQHWYEVGKTWGGSEMMKLAQSEYPNPPLVLFNWVYEKGTLPHLWSDEEKRYVELFGLGRDDNFKRKVNSIGYRVRLCNLQRGFRDGLTEMAWRQNSKFVTYVPMEPGVNGRYLGWIDYAAFYMENLYSEGDNYYPRSTSGSVFDVFPMISEGEEIDLFNTEIYPHLDNEVQGTLFMEMNRVFQVEEQKRLYPNFWRVIQPWHGMWVYTGNMSETPIISKERYAGFVQFGAWLTRPRVLRELSPRPDKYEAGKLYTFALINAVDRIHRNNTLREYWKESELVPNKYMPHPYPYLPSEYNSIDRNFLLTTDRDPADLEPYRPGVQWAMRTAFDVMCMARVKGVAPKRKFLVYCYAPTGEATNVVVRVPDVDTFTLPKIKVEGSYYSIEEKTVSRNKIKTKIWRVKEVVN